MAAKIQVHLAQAEWEPMLAASLAAVRASLGPDTTVPEDEIQRMAAMHPSVPATWEAIKQFWWACVRDEIPPIRCTYTEVQFLQGPYVRLEIEYSGPGGGGKP